jgi:PAS domain S-box-containing protein
MNAKKDQAILVGANTHTDQIYLGDAGIRLLYGILFTVLCLTIVLLLIRLMSGGKLFEGSAFIGALICCVLILLLHKKNTTLVLVLLLWSMVILPIFLGMRSFGLDAPGLFLVPVALMASSWVLTPRHGVVMSAIASLLYAAAYVLIINGQIVVSTPSSLSQFISFVGILITASLIGRIGANALRAEFNRVRELAESLTIKADELQRSEIGFASLFRSNPLPSLTGDVHGRVLDVNDAWLTTFGFRREDVVGRSTTELAVYVNVDERLQIAKDTVEHIGVIGKPVQMRLADGSMRIFLISTSSFQLSDGWRYVALLLDQTDRLAAEEAQHELNVVLSR